ncbi:hypothetical protein EDC01DRAFT_762977 [Geopyxis carbonaria]|nr:hypothetical protein EDC01DRAFT_762977 [Geopyxis carbonaria]
MACIRSQTAAAAVAENPLNTAQEAVTRAQMFDTIPRGEHRKALLCDVKLFLDRYFLGANGDVCPLKPSAAPDRPMVFKNLPAATRSSLAAVIADIPGLHMKELLPPKDPDVEVSFEHFDPLTGIGTGRAHVTKALRHKLVDNTDNEIRRAKFHESQLRAHGAREPDARGRWYLTCERLERRWVTWCDAGLRLVIDWDHQRAPAHEGAAEPLLGEFHLGVLSGLMRLWRDGEADDAYTSDTDTDTADSPPRAPTPRVRPSHPDPRKLHFRWRAMLHCGSPGPDDIWASDCGRNTGVLVFDKTFTSFRGVLRARHTWLGEDFQLRGAKIGSGDGIARGTRCERYWRRYGPGHCQERYHERPFPTSYPRSDSAWRLFNLSDLEDSDSD